MLAMTEILRNPRRIYAGRFEVEDLASTPWGFYNTKWFDGRIKTFERTGEDTGKKWRMKRMAHGVSHVWQLLFGLSLPASAEYCQYSFFGDLMIKEHPLSCFFKRAPNCLLLLRLSL